MIVERPHVYTAVRPRDDGFELCVVTQSADGETRLSHDDFKLTLDELRMLKLTVDRMVDHAS